MPFFYGALPFTSPWPCILIEDIHSSETVDVVEGFNDDETEDLQRVLVTSCSVDRRLRMTPTLLRYYFKQMQIKMSEKNIEVPFTFEDLEEDYYRTLPYTCGQTVFAIGFWLRTDVIRKRKSDDETRVLEMVARLRSVVEEAIAAHNWHHTNNI
ncbi:unnamed protein product [Haemonchus placei]|uniref:Protein kinase domain-containing protein n=1 Tax=Haemonchus placei TaxID=6290 RepID=A0A0N4WY42_HAEPC|nr:unnamed protein product [Haemonchus placei]